MIDFNSLSLVLSVVNNLLAYVVCMTLLECLNNSNLSNKQLLLKFLIHVKGKVCFVLECEAFNYCLIAYLGVN